MLFGAYQTATAAERIISGQTAVFDCSGVKPGDMLTLASGARGPLTIRNCDGTPANPIVVRNDPQGDGPTVIRRSGGSSGGFIFSCNSCIGVSIDGSYKWQGAPAGKTYGIKVTMTGGGAPSAFLRIAGLSRFVTIRNIEVDGAWPALAKSGSGIRINDQSVNRNAYPNVWREGILIEDSFVHDVAAEGMYIGPNYRDGDIPLRNIEIRNNRVEDIGWEAINTKSMWMGDNRIHHNVVLRAGKNASNTSKTTQYSGINNNAGTVKIYNNWIEMTGQHGIQVWTQDGPKISEGRGPFEAHIWNNVIVSAGGLWRPFMAKSFGINVGAQSGCEKPLPFIYSNTVVNPRLGGINVSSDAGAGYIRDNIVAGAGSNPVIKAPSFVVLINNRIGTVSQFEFVDPGDLNFRLKADSPARNEGSNAFPDKDFDDVTRPKDGAADQGAYEGTG
jgi:hypothetical protein